MNITYSKQSSKVLSRIDNTTKTRIRKGIELIPAGDIVPLTGSVDSFRLRVGDWRVIFSYPNENSIFIEKIAPRGAVYKGVR
ncbi:MAG: type II toxin-antitoxin system RelE/ParE family toxin [Oscillospiraceae bacterium]|nr:type II toxin-antitoxin system RelE/ParE family toxin [Oscillospiraceae bacterium]